jgi:predicted secreted Zn-dependent protease
VRTKLKELWACNKKSHVLAEEINELMRQRKQQTEETDRKEGAERA